MLYTEWNMEDALAVAREEGHEDGFEKGLEKGREKEQREIYELLSRGLSIEEIKLRLQPAAASRSLSDL